MDNITINITENPIQLAVAVSEFSQSNQNLSAYASGNTKYATSGSFNASNFWINGLGNVSVGFSNGSLMISGSGGTGGGGSGGAAISAGSNSQNSGTVVFNNSNGITFGMDTNGGVTASYTVPTFNQSNQPVAANGSNGSFLFSTLSFGIQNGLTFYTSNGSIVGSYSVPSQSADTGKAGTGFTSAGAGIGLSGTLNTNGFSLSATVPSQTVQPVAVSGSNGSFAFSTLSFGGSNGLSFYTTNGSIVGSYTVPAGGGVTVFSNSNNVSFGLNGSTVTATATFSQSNQNISLFALGNTTQNSSTVLNANALSFNGGGNITVGFSNGSIQISQTGGGGQSNQTLGLYALGNTTQNSSTTLDARTLSFNAIGSLTVGYSNGSIQFSAPNALTTAAQSNQVVNSLNGSTGAISLNVGSSLSASTNGSSIIFGLASNITTALQSAGPYLTTARASNDAIGLNSALTANGVSMTANSSGLSLNFPAFLTSQSNQAFSADASSTFQTLSFQNSNGVSFSNNAGALRVTHDLQFTSATSAITSNALNTSVSRVINIVAATNNTGGGTASLSGNVSFSNVNGMTFYTSAGGAIAGSYTVPSQTVQPVAASGSNGSFNFSTVTFGNLNGLSFYSSNGSMVGSYTVPTQSTQPVAASGSNGSFAFSTLSFGNLNGLSFYTSNGSIVGSYTNGGGGGTTNQTGPNIADANGNTVTSGTVVFSNSNLITFGLNVSVMTASYGDPDNWQLIGANTAGTTASTIGTDALYFSGGNNITLSGNSNTIVISAGNGGGGLTMNDWLPYQMALTTNTSIGAGSVYFCPVMPQNNVSFSIIEIISSNAIGTFTGAFTKGMTLSYGLYSENGASLSLMSSSSIGITISQNSSTALGLTYSDGNGNFSLNTNNSTHSAINIFKAISLPFTGTISGGGLYFWGQNMSTSSAGSNVAVTFSQLFNAEIATSNIGGWGGTQGVGTNKSIIQEPYGFIRSATSAGLPSSCAYTDVSAYSNYQPYIYFEA